MNENNALENRRANAVAAVFALALLALALWLGQQARPVALPDLHLDAGERLACVSYSPFHLPGQTPLNPHAFIPPAQIRADLAALAERTACVRIYSTDQGLDAVLPAARELGLKVILGAWLGVDTAANERALTRAIELANANTDVVDVLMVGNEVLLRQEQTPAQMMAWLQRAKAQSRVPVSYADVWEFWRQNRALAQWVDQVTVHILPFWEDEPVPIEYAVRHVGETFARMQREFPDKLVRIGETGWPGAGRQRRKAVPSRVNQARFVREFVAAAHANGWRYNFIEAIDQPWKRQLEGTVGGHWGVLDAHLQPKFPLTGEVSERDSLALPALAGALMAALCLLCAGRRAGARARLAALFSGLCAGALGVLVWEHAQQAWRDALEWTALGVVSVSALLLVALAARLRNAPLPAFAPRHAQEDGAPSAAWLFSALRLLVLFAAAVAALLLVFDPRYRDFPIWQFAAPALLFLALRLGGERLPAPALQERTCALTLTVCAPIRWAMDPLNPEAIIWLATALGMAAVAVEGRAKKAD